MGRRHLHGNGLILILPVDLNCPFLTSTERLHSALTLTAGPRRRVILTDTFPPDVDHSVHVVLLWATNLGLDDFPAMSVTLGRTRGLPRHHAFTIDRPKMDRIGPVVIVGGSHSSH